LLLQGQTNDSEDERFFWDLCKKYLQEFASQDTIERIKFCIFRGINSDNTDLIQILDEFMTFLYETIQNKEKAGIIIYNVPIYAEFMKDLES